MVSFYSQNVWLKSIKEFIIQTVIQLAMNHGYLREGKDADYNSPEDAFSFGRLMIYMFSSWSLAWKLTFFPMQQVKRYY